MLHDVSNHRFSASSNRLVIAASRAALALTLVLLGLPTVASAGGEPGFSKLFTPDEIGPGSVSTLTFSIVNVLSTPVEDLAFSDTLPAGMTIAAPAAASTDCTNGVVVAPAGGTTITFSDGSIAGFASCSVRVDVTSATVGVSMNTSSSLTSDAGTSGPATADLTVATDRPGFSKSFSPSSISLGGRSTLTFTIDNSANVSPLSSLAFTDDFPVGMTVADPANASFTCGGPNPILTAVPGEDSIAFSSFGILFPGFEVLLAGATCTVTVDVTASAAGMLDNVTGDLTSNAGSSGTASDTLEVTVSEVTLIKQFVDDPVPPGGTVVLDFSLQSFNRTETATDIGFTDDLDATLTGLAPSGVLPTAPCGAGSTLTFVSGVLTLANGTLPPEGSCTFSVTLDVPIGSLSGIYPNTTSPIGFDFGGGPSVGNAASDSLFVTGAPVITKEFLTDPVRPGDPVTVRFTLTNTSPTSQATAVAFTDLFATVLPTASVTPGNGCCGAGSICTFAPLSNPPPPSDVIPATFTLSGGTLEPAGMAGDSCTFDVTLDLNVDAAPGVVDNITSPVTAIIDAIEETGEPATDSFAVIAAPNLTKVFTDDPVAPGGTVTLEFSLEHSPNADLATDITFTDDLAPVLAGLTANLPSTPDPPCGPGSTLTGSAGDTLLTLMGGSLMPGDVCTFSVTLDVPAGAAPGAYTNTTSGVSAMVGGVAATSAAASDDLDVAGLTVEKMFIGDPVIPGQTVGLRFTLTNISPTDDATAISFTDDLSAVLPGLPDLSVVTALPLNACGGTLSTITPTFLIFAGGVVNQGDPPCSFDITLLVPAGGVADGTYSNATGNPTALIDGSVVVLPPATDFLEVSSTLLNISKEFTDDPVAPGGSVTLAFTLSNLDTANAASAVGFTDNFETTLSGLTFDSVLTDSCGGTNAGTGTTLLDVSGVALAAGASCTIEVSLTVPAGAIAGDYNNTTSDVTGSIGGFAVSGTPATDVLSVLDLLTFTKAFDGPTTASGTATLTFTITNPGDSTATGIAFTDDLDSVISGLVATNLPLNDVCGAGSIVAGTSFLTFNGGMLPPMGGTCSFDVDVQVPVTATAGTFPNTTSVLTQFGIQVAEPATADLVIEPPPTFAKGFAPSAIGLGQTSTVTLTIDNTASVLAATSLDVTDNLPAGLVVATPPNASTTCTDGTITAVAGSSTVTYTGGTVGAGGVCSVSFDVLATAVGMLVNTTGDLTSSSGNSGTAMATLVVNPQPGFAKAFAPNPILVDGVSTLTLTVDNSASTVAATLLDVTDNLPAGTEVAATPNAMTTCTGGTLTAAAGAGTISYTGGTVGAGATCTVSVDVTATMAGDFVNLTGDLTSSLGNSGTATDTLRANPAPGFMKSFTPDAINAGAPSTLTLTIDNTGSTVDATALDVTDNLPGSVVVAATPNASTSCTGGTLTATAGMAVITYTGGTVTAGATCTVTVDVTATTSGAFINTTGDLTSSLGNSGTASATLNVTLIAPGFAKAFAPNPISITNVSTLTFTIDNTGSLVDATALDFTDNLPAGVVVATPANASTTCTGGTLTATDGTSTITYTGGTVAASATCTITVDTLGVAVGSHVNLSGNLTSSSGDSGTATDTLVVEAVPPVFAKTFTPDVISEGGVSTLTFTIDNPINDVAVDGLAFTDSLPAGLVVATPANVNNGCGGTLTATPGSGTISLGGGSVAAMATCTIDVDTTSAAAGTYDNSVMLESDAGPAGPATATLTVVAEIGFTKMFLGDPVLRGGLVDLEYTITNPSTAFDLENVNFTDDLDSAVPGLAAIGLPTADVCGIGSTVAGTGTVTLTGGGIPAGASCTFTISVQVPADAMIGTFVSTSGPVAGTTVPVVPGPGGGGGNVMGPPADASITIVFLTIEKSFPSEPVVAGTSVGLTFTLTNPDPINAAMDVGFTDDLEAVIPGFVAEGLPIADVCGAGSEVSGTSVITLTGGILDPGGSCTFVVPVLVPSATNGDDFTNVTSVVSASVAGNAVVGDDGTGAVAVIQVLSNALAIPTLGTWGLIAMILGLMIVAVSRMRLS